MINMKRKAKDHHDCPEVSGDAPEYPYGLCLSLGNEELEKLGITELPAVGSQMTVTALVTVQSVGMHSQKDGDQERHAELQITDMELAGERPDPAQTLYG